MGIPRTRVGRQEVRVTFTPPEVSRDWSEATLILPKGGRLYSSSPGGVPKNRGGRDDTQRDPACVKRVGIG
jgi:hypothetical protein